MNPDDARYIQALTKLGLTPLQATIYMALRRTGQAGIMKISKTSNIARPEVYRVLPSLEKKGLVEKIVSNPTMYESVSLKQGFSMLLSQKTQENTDLQIETQALLNSIQEENFTKFSEKESQLVITSEIRLFTKKFDQALRETQRTIDLVCINRDFPKLLFNHLQGFKEAMNKGVRIRMVIEKVEIQSFIEIFEGLKRSPLFSLKYTSEHTPVCMLICDDRKVTMQLSDAVVPSLFSNNRQIVKVASSHFKRLWSEAEGNANKFVHRDLQRRLPERLTIAEIE
jgi:sugar-specific transcriptional regulator TrmB